MKKRMTYSRAFKLKAVRLLETTNKPVAELARELNIGRNQLYRWKAQFGQKDKAEFLDRDRRATTMDEVTLLKLELEQLKEENSILKKTVAYFAKAIE